MPSNELIAGLVYLVIVYFFLWLRDLFWYVKWEYPQYHWAQLIRLWIGGGFLLVMGTWGIGMAFK